MPRPRKSEKPTAARSSAEAASASAIPKFVEAPAWRTVAGGWRPLSGNFRNLGFSFEWHSFRSAETLDWAKSFHPGSVELCLNLAGRGRLEDAQGSCEVGQHTYGFYYQGDPSLRASRQQGELHQFITVEFAPEFLERHLSSEVENLHPLIRAVVRREAAGSMVAPSQRLGTALLQLVESLRHPPVFAPAQAIWFQTKAVEIAARLFFSPSGGELFCTRAQRAARERVERVRAIIRENASDPPPLEQLGKIVGCSSFYLSRLFSQEAGMTLQQYIRQVRMERAAELLRTGQCNVTEAALEVGYNSLSHFSSAFHETFGCCPGLYPLQTPAQGTR